MKIKNMKGSDAAFERTKLLIEQWSEHRNGCLEELAFITMSEGLTLDQGLDRMAEMGKLTDWPPTDSEKSPPDAPLWDGVT